MPHASVASSSESFYLPFDDVVVVVEEEEENRNRNQKQRARERERESNMGKKKKSEKCLINKAQKVHHSLNGDIPTAIIKLRCSE